TLGSGLQNGDDRATIALVARSYGGGAAKDTMVNKIDPYRTALRYFKLSAAAQPGDTASFLVGSTSVILGQRLANDPVAVKQCAVAKERQNLVVEALIELPKAGRVFPREVPRLMELATKLGPY